MFFESKQYPGMGMNRHGVILAKSGHMLAEHDLWPRDWTWRPIRRGFRLLASVIEYEAIDAGFTRRFPGHGESYWTKPGK